MSPKTTHPPVLRTKLYRPPVPTDHVHRIGLLERLEKNPQRPSVLVSAPAGYGKTTLVSCWLDACERRSAWLSLDERDNDLRRFVEHFVAAVQAAVPESVGDTAALVDSPTLPPMPVLATTLLNDLQRIEQDFIVALDDVHVIHDRTVHALLEMILRQPPRSMQLVLVGRRDPALPIASLRARGMLTELRMQDLLFSVDEATEFLQAAVREEIDEATAAELTRKAEGWVTGLRLAVLAMRGTEDPGRKPLELKGTARYVADFLVSEVLDRQPAGIRERLLNTSILHRFCAPLCDALFGADGTRDREVDGQAFIHWLSENNLFVVPLDTEHRWFRYHQLFEDLLRSGLDRKKTPPEIRALRLRASAWCEDQALYDEAIDYALEAGDSETAATIVERHLNVEFDANRWQVGGGWLDRLPDAVKQHRPRLLLAEARVLNEKFRLADIPPLVRRAQVLLEERPDEPSVQGELFYFLGFLHFWQGDGANGQAQLAKALETVPESSESHLRAQIELYSALTTHLNGRTDEAIQALHGWIDQRHLRSGMVWERLRFGLALIHLLNGDLAPCCHDARLLLEDARRKGNTFVETWGDYLLGLAAFHGRNLDGARRHFGQVMNHRYAANHRVGLDSVLGFAIASELLGQPHEADRSLKLAHDYARWTADESNLKIVYASEARIALLRGDLDAAFRWQHGFREPWQVPGMLCFLANPNIDECRVLAAVGSDDGLAEAAGKLEMLRQQTEALHYTCQTIEILALQALVANRQGRQELALGFLETSVGLVGPGAWIRPLIEAGAPMADLLRQLLERDPGADHVRAILAAFRDPAPHSTRPRALPGPLTHRELDVMELLSERLRNKEIAEKLSVSPITVKSHLRNIYQKLNVGKRREAVKRARALGIVR